jgi:alanine racemase
MVPCARAALEAGATWLGVATPEESLALRAAGVGGRVLCWLWTPGGPWRACVEADVEVTVGARWALAEVTEAARAAGRPAQVQLKIDAGLGRNGAQPADWPDLTAAARAAERSGLIRVTGVWAHFSCADQPGHPSIDRELAVFRTALRQAEDAGLTPEVRHIANSPGTLTLPESHFDLVRPGVAMYGISPVPQVGSPADFGLRPVMTFTARLASVKRVPGGHGVSYGHQYVTSRATTLALVPVGYADGVPRHASGAGPVLVAGKRRVVAGRVAMDQFVVDLDGDAASPGDEAVLFGPGDRGEPTAEDWAGACGTIAYEIVTRIGPRVPREYVGAAVGAGEPADPGASGTAGPPGTSGAPGGSGPSGHTVHTGAGAGSTGGR